MCIRDSTSTNTWVYKWASQVIETVRRYRDEAYRVYQELSSVPRVTGHYYAIDKVGKRKAVVYEIYGLYVPRYQKYFEVKRVKAIAEGYYLEMRRRFRPYILV